MEMSDTAYWEYIETQSELKGKFGIVTMIYAIKLIYLSVI